MTPYCCEAYPRTGKHNVDCPQVRRAFLSFARMRAEDDSKARIRAMFGTKQKGA